MMGPGEQRRARRTDNRASAREADPDEVSLSAFVLRARALAALGRAGITTVDQARSLSDQDLLGVTNVGPKSVADLHRALAQRSLRPEDALSCLALPRPLSARNEAMVHLHASGAGFTAIARHFGISRTRVKQIVDGTE
ncbi:MAG: DNA-directed RNA polymerase subunit alpha C-terminal domain-containing protein [Acidimicrobiales bacterium]